MPSTGLKLKSVLKAALRGRDPTQAFLLEGLTNKHPRTADHSSSEPKVTSKPLQCYLMDNLQTNDPFRIMKEHLKQRSDCNGTLPPSSCKLVVLGGPGVGKGSYSPFLSSWLGIPHISTGDLVRQELSKPASSCSTSGDLMLRESIRTSMNEGKLIQDAIILKLLANRLREMKPNVGFLLDGFPRTINQAHILNDAVGGIDMALNFHLEDDILLAKCLGRRVCSECGQNYNLAHVDFVIQDNNAEATCKQKRVFLPAHLPPPECASKLQVRGDDSNEEAVRERLRLYASESRPVEQYYRSQGKLVDINVGPGVEYVWPRLLDVINNFEEH